MIAVPRLQEFVCGLSLKKSSLLILYILQVGLFFGLVIVTSIRFQEKPTAENSEIDFQYVLNMVVAICLFLVTPLGIYGTQRERANFLIPYLAMHLVGMILLALNFLIEFYQLFSDGSLFNAFILLVILVPVSYSFLIVFSHYSAIKEQREELK